MPGLFSSLESSAGALNTFQRALDVIGPGRLLYGTDSSTFPRGYRRDLLQAQQVALRVEAYRVLAAAGTHLVQETAAVVTAFQDHAGVRQ